MRLTKPASSRSILASSRSSSARHPGFRRTSAASINSLHCYCVAQECGESGEQRAERQHLPVEPENGVVARELERRWEQALQEFERVRHASVSNTREAAKTQEMVTRGAPVLIRPISAACENPFALQRSNKPWA